MQTQEAPSEHQENTFFAVRVTRELALVAQAGCGVPILGDTQKLPEHDPGQPSLGGLA